MPLRLAYLTVTNTFVVLRLLPLSDRDTDAEILALRPSRAAAPAGRRKGEVHRSRSCLPRGQAGIVSRCMGKPLALPMVAHC